MPRNTRLTPREINKFCKETDNQNLQKLRQSLRDNEWHWLLPEDWAANEENMAVLFHAINAYLEFSV